MADHLVVLGRADADVASRLLPAKATAWRDVNSGWSIESRGPTRGRAHWPYISPNQLKWLTRPADRTRLFQGLRMRSFCAAEAARNERAPIVQLAMLQADPGLARVAAGGDDRTVAAWAPLWPLSMGSMRLICRNAYPTPIGLDFAKGRGALYHSSPLPRGGRCAKVGSWRRVGAWMRCRISVSAMAVTVLPWLRFSRWLEVHEWASDAGVEGICVVLIERGKPAPALLGSLNASALAAGWAIRSANASSAMRLCGRARIISSAAWRMRHPIMFRHPTR